MFSQEICQEKENLRLAFFTEVGDPAAAEI